MQHSVHDLLGSTLVPVLGADVAAGSASYIHLALVGVATIGADPNLAIGKEGQNARLAARLTGYKIDIKSETQAIESGDLPENYMELMEMEDDGMSEDYM